MTREEIIRMAREAGINFDPAGPGDDGIDTWYGNQWLPDGAIVKIIEIVQAAEREACAKVCDELNSFDYDDPGESCAAAIRARGKEGKDASKTQARE